MAGVRPTEGDVLSGMILLKAVNVNTFQANTDRSSNLKLCLYSNNPTIDDSIVMASLTKVTGSGYVDKDLTDASWSNTGAQFNYAAQTFTPSGGNWTVYGYFIHTNAQGSGSAKVLAVEKDPNAPITVNNGSDYIITPQITFS